ncbi:MULTISPECIES: hypothetical protein [unclassified Oceanobacter]|uniref:hypothetical protein n=1 Tax=unclassified Oceanobacter TaxID=2620260 RepID=UPI002735B949|nr:MULTISPECIES: hypothetical protein [unclassified Oceanobacter]MDP2506598.1 hypothetical protein [Oceanobacter sp. 3_MG-2023]MDP2548955.1 hypothetical protein [Oceanobacter sp. 4_MG-2023]MDP2609661.1 hypothetical protein [Oceanobacter sp. 1_MG-2023]MDP2613379.1 hypothetical protein [Oceanobacter sp. 2_MG-2023]
MKKMLAVVLLGVSASVTAQAVEIKKSVDEQRCRMVKQSTCINNGRNGIQHCQQEHRQSAAEFGADQIVITSTNQSDHRKRMATGNYKNFTKTKMTARYYVCDDRIQQHQNMQREVVVPPAQGKTVEERLLRLQTLREKNLLSEQEYRTKRAEILSEL